MPLASCVRARDHSDALAVRAQGWQAVIMDTNRGVGAQGNEAQTTCSTGKVLTRPATTHAGTTCSHCNELSHRYPANQAGIEPGFCALYIASPCCKAFD